MELHSVGHRGGVVCAPHHFAVETGRAVLAEGGNAIEAMVAMAAAAVVVYPHMNHLGGDGFWIIREPNGRVYTIMAAGPAGAVAAPNLYSEYKTIPIRGPLAALTVPGTVAGWAVALEAAKAHSGRLPLDVLLAPAIARARDGYVVTHSQALAAQKFLDELTMLPGFAKTFLNEGKAPEAGSTLKQKALANTLAHLARNGLEDFYRGDVGHAITADLERIGSPITRADLIKFRAKIAMPLSADLKVGTVFNTNAPTQGIASLIILALFDRLEVSKGESFEHIHGLVEATKYALHFRDCSVTDPSRLARPLQYGLDSRIIAAQAKKINNKISSGPLISGDGDTVWMGSADASGLVVSFIQSIYWEFGSGCVLGATGVLMQNRGVSFSLKTSSLNKLAPGCVPFHTLNPAIAVLKDGRTMGYGAMGGHGQPQTQSAVFTRHVLFKETLGEAIERPRWFLRRDVGAEKSMIVLEPRFESTVLTALADAGHNIVLLDEPYSEKMGHAGAVVLHSNGTCEGAHDPRAHGGAAGI
jgi:gamma-glutamyltranspeptidase